MEVKYRYLDNSSITRMDERVLEAMKPYFFEKYAIPTSETGYSMGIEAREALEDSRNYLANYIGAGEGELIFTSGSSESSNAAIKGAAIAQKNKKGNHLIVSKIEDFPVLNSFKSLEKQGYEVSYLDVDEYGMVDPETIQKLIKPETSLVSVQHANQEIGTIQDIKTIAEICNEKNVLLHTDATHTFTKLPLDLHEIKADMVTISAHTLHGPSGIGALYLKKGTPFNKYLDGGFQEFNKRGGLENIPGAVGFKKAVELTSSEENDKFIQMRDHLMQRVLNEIPHTTLNGHPTERIPQNANITFDYVEGESITLHLDMRGFAVSTGSACFSRSLQASHVILGIGGDPERAHGSLRITFGRFNSMDDVGAMADALNEIVSKLREISAIGTQ
ncbi:Cysteine desulfurase [Methanobacterium lacus]|uniref:Cysteine desulfurase n=1 Tax=Methanobacterium lacus (strain AL-21) TaxID=877455 RepID=F0TAJ8_METLA|nr:cysteine desulfurase family protein [Methanobacterium lacus]ADZ10070.1 Cysteine desulfurase [Methanobacterium lacus]